MLLNGLVDVIGDRSTVRGLEGLAPAVNQGTVKQADEALKDRLNVATVAPQASREVSGNEDLQCLTYIGKTRKEP